MLTMYRVLINAADIKN